MNKNIQAKKKVQEQNRLIPILSMPEFDPQDMKTFGNAKMILTIQFPKWLETWWINYKDLFGRKQRANYLREALVLHTQYQKIIEKIYYQKDLTIYEQTLIKQILMKEKLYLSLDK